MRVSVTRLLLPFHLAADPQGTSWHTPWSAGFTLLDAFHTYTLLDGAHFSIHTPWWCTLLYVRFSYSFIQGTSLPDHKLVATACQLNCQICTMPPIWKGTVSLAASPAFSEKWHERHQKCKTSFACISTWAACGIVFWRFLEHVFWFRMSRFSGVGDQLGCLSNTSKPGSPSRVPVTISS